MNLKTFSFCILLLLSLSGLAAGAQPSFDKVSFYSSMQSKDMNDIDAQLKIIDASSVKEKSAYSGALLMKKAGLAKGASNKLSLFRSGYKKLEASIKKNNANAELHFLRLIVQENAPGILGYKNNMQQDGDFIKKYFSNLPHVVQQAISDYSKQSKILKPADFNLAKNE